MSRYARLRTDLVSASSQVDGATVYTVKDPVSGSYFRLRDPEYWLIHQLDGDKSPDQIAQAFREKYGFELSAEQVAEFTSTLEKLYFLEDGRSEQELSRAVRKAARKRSLAARLLFIKLKAFKPGRLLDLLAGAYRPFHSQFWMLAQVVVIVAGIGLLAANAGQFGIRLYELLQVSSILAIVLSIFLLVSFHEFAHAVLCRYYGGQVREMGFLVLYFQPCFYCDISDVWLFKKKSQRLAVTWAGLHFQLVFLALALIFWKVTVAGYFLNELARTCIIVGWVTFLFNLNPLIKLDGYYLLSDWLEIPNLRSKAFLYLKNGFQRRILGWPIERLDVTNREHRIFLTYALLASVYSLALILYFLKLLAGFVTTLLGGSGMLLLLIALAIILRQNIGELARGVIQHLKYMKNLLKRPARLVTYGIVLIAIIVLGFFIPVPNRVSGKVVTGPIAEYEVALSTTDLVQMTMRRGGETPEQRSNLIKLVSSEVGAYELSPIVREGQQVKTGDTLAVVTSNQVAKDIVSAIEELHRLESNLALLKAPRKREEIAEAQAKVDAAQVNLDQLTRDAKRIEDLATKNLVSTDKVEAARSAVGVAKAELADRKSSLALLKSPPRPEEVTVLEHSIAGQRSRLEYLKGQAEAQVVTSPINGTVTFSRRPTDLLNIIDISSLEIQVPVSDFDIKRIAAGQTAELKVHSFATENFPGKVVRVPRFAVSAGSDLRFPVAVVVDNSDGLLKQGMSGYAKIEVGSTSVFGFLFRKLASMIYVEVWSWF